LDAFDLLRLFKVKLIYKSVLGLTAYNKASKVYGLIVETQVNDYERHCSKRFTDSTKTRYFG